MLRPGAETGIEQIATGLVSAIRETEARTGIGLANVILLETMTGKGSEMGGSFEELRAILDRTAELWYSSAGMDSHTMGRSTSGQHAGDLVNRDPENKNEERNVWQTETGFADRENISNKLGVCLDTCHVWDAGYDIVSDLDGVLADFDRVIGLDRLYAVHLNDSKNGCGARKDRHEKLGQGMIGAEALRRVVQHPLLQGKPFILETPNEDEGYRQEIATVREWMM